MRKLGDGQGRVLSRLSCLTLFAAFKEASVSRPRMGTYPGVQFFFKFTSFRSVGQYLVLGRYLHPRSL